MAKGQKLHSLKIVRSMNFVNDTAEREVQLMTHFNTILTKDENQKKYLITVIND